LLGTAIYSYDIKVNQSQQQSEYLKQHSPQHLQMQKLSTAASGSS
jgi:hypothetical protein